VVEENQEEASIRLAINSAEILTRGFSKTKQGATDSTSIFCVQVWLVFRMQFTDNDSLRAGRSEDQIPVGARFSAPVQTGPGPHPASYTMGTGSFRGKTAGAWR